MRQRVLPVLVFMVVFVSPAFAQYARVSVSSAGVEANGASSSPSLSDDGRYVAFSSLAVNLVAAADTNGAADCFLHDRDADTDGIFDEAAARTTVRVSITTGGAEFQGACTSPVVSGDGRYVAFLTKAPIPAGLGSFPGSGNGFQQVLRWDRTTGAIDVVSQILNTLGNGDSDAVDMSNDGRLVIFRSKSTNWIVADHGAIANIFLKDMQTGAITKLSPPAPATVQLFLHDTPNAYSQPSLSGDGKLAAFTRFASQYVSASVGYQDDAHLFIVNVETGGDAVEIASEIRARLTDDGRALTVMGTHVTFYSDLARRQPAPGRRFPGSLPFPDTTLRIHHDRIEPFVIGQDGRYGASLIETTPTPSSSLYDLDYHAVFALPFNGLSGAFDASSRYLAIETKDALALSADTNTTYDIYVADLPAVFDADNDTLDDRWETTFGLSTTSGGGADGPTGDPDNDGVTNAAELAAGSHPRGTHKVYLAEGASGSFFTTQLALANPNVSETARVLVTFLRPSQAPLHAYVPVSARSRRTLFPADTGGLEAADFSMVVESDALVAADRTMSWDATGYGAHTETAAAAPATTWYLAEGSTVVDFNLFYLLQNPQPTTVDATIRYLRPSGAPIVKTVSLPPNSRTTIYVNEADPALAETDVSGVIEASAPIVVERAMYANRPNQPFALGHATKGVTTPATSWFLAEGATGAFFDTYVLIANPSTSNAAVDVKFLKPDGSVVTQTHTVAAQSRFSIFVDSVAGLESTAVATTVTSTNAVPIIVERAMYWPGGFFDYYEGHSSAGTTTTATKWVLAEGERGGSRSAQTFVLIANTSNQPGQARIAYLPDAGYSPGPFNPTTDNLTVDLPPNSRTTVELGPPFIGSPQRFGALVESLGDTPVPIVVEGAFYWSPGGILWAAGSNVVATPVP